MKLFSLKNIPLTVVISFNLFTLLIFVTAPMKWKTDNISLFLIYSLFCQFMIVLGYHIGFKRFTKTFLKEKILSTLPQYGLNLIFIFYIVTFLIKYAYLLRLQFYDVLGMINFLLIGVGDSRLGYVLSLDTTRPYTISWIVYFLISIVDQLFFIICFLQWKQMNNYKKYLTIFLVLIELFYWIGRGTNFGVIIMVTTLIFAYSYKFKSIKLSFLKNIKYIFIVIILLIGSISIFSTIMNNRRGNSTLDYQQFNLGAATVDENDIVFSVVPPAIQDTYMYVVSYLSQGYYHTCLALDLDFNTTYFLGNNPSVIDLAKVFGVDVWKDTYMYRLKEKGVDPLINWHSAYTWYASDVSFYCVPILLSFIGYLFGISWYLGLKQHDFLSKIMFVILGNMLLFLFANNTYLSSVFYSFIFLLPIWYFTRVRQYKIN